MKPVTLKKALERYNTEFSAKKKSHAVETFRIAALQRTWLAQIPVHKITNLDLIKYRDERLATINRKTGRLLSPGTVRVELSLLSAVFNVCRREWQYCKSNPLDNVTKPKPSPGRTRRISAREDRAILQYTANLSNIEFFSIYVLAIETGMRQSEILSLEWANVNLRRRVAHLPDTKNNTSRDVPLSLRARDAILRLGAQRSGRIFMYTAAGLKTAWRTMLRQLDIINLKFHDARHEAISRFFELGTLSMMEIAMISGHKTLSMLKRYTHLRAEKLVRKIDQARRRVRYTIEDLMVSYQATVQNVDGRFILSFPDFENLHVADSTLEDVTRKASDALLRRVSLLAAKRMPLPAPEPLPDSPSVSIVTIDSLSITDVDQDTLDTVFSLQ